MRVRALLPADTHLAGVLVKALMGHQTASSLVVIELYPGHHDVLPMKCWAWSISPQAVLGPPWLAYTPSGIIEEMTCAWWRTIPSHLSAGRYLPHCHVLLSFSGWGCHLHFPVHRQRSSQGHHGLQHSVFSTPVLLRVSQRSWSDLSPNAICHRNNSHTIELVSELLAGS